MGADGCLAPKCSVTNGVRAGNGGGGGSATKHLGGCTDLVD